MVIFWVVRIAIVNTVFHDKNMENASRVCFHVFTKNIHVRYHFEKNHLSKPFLFALKHRLHLASEREDEQHG